MADTNTTVQQKTWFITGAARGLGLEIANAALAAGDNVVVTGRNIGALHNAYANADGVLALELDVCNHSQVERCVEEAVNHFGRIDVVVNNAGYGQLGLFEEISEGRIEPQFETNVFGVMAVTRAVLPVMRRQRSGHIFNLSSIGGVAGFDGASIYCATKYAVEGFSASLALELKQFGIAVTIVEPGFFRTDFLDSSSVQYGDHKLDDYQAYSDAVNSQYEQHNHQQAGDPKKLGQVMVRLAREENPPLHFGAGSDAVQVITETLARRLDEVKQWSELSKSTDFTA